MTLSLVPVPSNTPGYFEDITGFVQNQWGRSDLPPAKQPSLKLSGFKPELKNISTQWSGEMGVGSTPIITQKVPYHVFHEEFLYSSSPPSPPSGILSMNIAAYLMPRSVTLSSLRISPGLRKAHLQLNGTASYTCYQASIACPCIND